MRIESIEIHNYRQYGDTIYKFPDKSEYDLHIIKGKNGMGKTNLLNAITWCLYNKEPHLGIANSGKPRLNTKVLAEARNSGVDRCEISVIFTISDRGSNINFERRQEISTESLFQFKSEFSLTYMESDGETKVYTDADTCNKYVNLYMPQDIREYFFFDGEHLEKYFINEQGEKIRKAIHLVSQVKLLTSMKDRLKVVIDEFNGEAGKKNKDISGLISQQTDLEEKVNKLDTDINELQRQILLSENIVAECSEFLKGKEGVPDKEKEFNELQKDIVSLNEEREEIDIDIHKFIRRYKTLFSFYPSIKEAYGIITTKEAEGAFPPAIDKDYLKRMISYHKCLVCDRDLCEHEEEHVKKLIAEVSVANNASHILHGIKGELENLIDETRDYKIKKERLFGKRLTVEKTLEKAETQLNNLDSELKQFIDKEKVKEIHRKRMNNLDLLESNRRKKAKFENDVEKFGAELEEIKNKIEKARTSIKEFETINKEIEFANKARDIISDIEIEMMDEVREKMKIETMKIFSELEWKEESFSKIELDEKYKLEMYDTDGFSTVGTCSAGERALLALSFTLALQKVAGYDSMLFIDTPVGRIDTENRKNFADVLKNVSKDKQVIVTLTTSEYSKEIQSVFEPINSSFVELVTNDEKITTLMEE
jgi:DNA sulfur modification protein DndD